MRGATRSAVTTLASLTIVVAIAGCAGKSWQFWKSDSAEAPAESTASTPPAEPVAAATPAAPEAAPTATPSQPAETAAAPAPSSNGYVELPGLAHVRFRSGQVGLVKADHKVLDSLLRWLKEHPNAVVVIEGHTDDLGTRESNMIVGEKRAASVARYLVARGLEASRVSTASVGSDRPVCTEKTDSCRARNRRARFLVKQH